MIDSNREAIEDIRNQTSDDIGVPQTIAQIFGLPANASVSDVIQALHTEDQSIIDGITNGNKLQMTHDYKTAGTYTFTARGTKGMAVVIGGGGGGENKMISPPYASNAFAGSIGGGGGKVVVSSVINLDKGSSYNVVVGKGGSQGSNGTTSSAFSATADGGTAGGGAAPGGVAQWTNNDPDPLVGNSGANGGAVNAVSSSVGSFCTYDGAGGGGGTSGIWYLGGGWSIITSCMEGKGGTSQGGGSGGNGSYAIPSYTPNIKNPTNGSNATVAGSGGGGAGGWSLGTRRTEGGTNTEVQSSKATSGSGAPGRVIIYESGIYDFS